jgi:hypothetical protein
VRSPADAELQPLSTIIVPLSTIIVPLSTTIVPLSTIIVCLSQVGLDSCLPCTQWHDAALQISPSRPCKMSTTPSYDIDSQRASPSRHDVTVRKLHDRKLPPPLTVVVQQAAENADPDSQDDPELGQICTRNAPIAIYLNTYPLHNLLLYRSAQCPLATHINATAGHVQCIVHRRVYSNAASDRCTSRHTNLNCLRRFCTHAAA